MSREVLDLASNSIKGDPRPTYKATDENLILDARRRQPPMNRMSCGSQPANIRLINRREKLPYLFCYHNYTIFLKSRSEMKK
jgi:hypothetical protein